MQRRHILILGAAGVGGPAFAHHGWSSFDDTKPIYLEGKAATVKWQNPHVELILDLPPNMGLPPELAKRSVPNQTAPVDGPAILSKTTLPKRKDNRWEIELAPISRMQAWKVPEISSGESLSVVGYTFKDEKGSAILRVEYLWLGQETYALRSSPVG